jgi:DNA polymerase III delta prime subunit
MAPQGTAGSPLAGFKLIILDEADAMTSTAQMVVQLEAPRARTCKGLDLFSNNINTTIITCIQL